MLQKFPQKTMKKWIRFNIFEKGYIVYSLLISSLILILPIYQIGGIETGFEIEKYSLLNNSYYFTTSILIGVLLIIMVLRNVSFRFKKMIQFFIGFKDNEALVNFGILLILSVTIIGLGETVNLFGERISTGIKLVYGYYIIAGLLILGLIGNLLLAVNFSKNKKKSQLVNIIQKQPEEPEVDQIKGLFE